MPLISSVCPSTGPMHCFFGAFLFPIRASCLCHCLSTCQARGTALTTVALINICNIMGGLDTGQEFWDGFRADICYIMSSTLNNVAKYSCFHAKVLVRQLPALPWTN